jgi:hypothetical protein
MENTLIEYLGPPRDVDGQSAWASPFTEGERIVLDPSGNTCSSSKVWEPETFVMQLEDCDHDTAKQCVDNLMARYTRTTEVDA